MGKRDFATIVDELPPELPQRSRSPSCLAVSHTPAPRLLCCLAELPGGSPRSIQRRDEQEKRAVVLRITGMLDRPEGPLTLFVPEAGGKNREFKLSHNDFDRDLVRIGRKDGVTTIEFLPKGRQLLRSGAWFQYIDFFRN